jgi:hypothetical protein
VNIETLFSIKQYSLPYEEKAEILFQGLNELTNYHLKRCEEFSRLMSVIYPQYDFSGALSDIPYLPIGLFKSHKLASIPDSEIFKTLTSSGTTSQTVSRIYLDRETARRQTIALAKIMTYVLGPKRLPMIIVESESLLKNRTMLSARGAGVLGMMNFGRDYFYALDENMELDEPGLKNFFKKHGDEVFLIFGFTFMVWKYFLLRLIGVGLDLSKGILIHSGGWKKLQEDSVDNKEFKRRFEQTTGLRRIYNFYGMVEQIGSVFLEGEDGYLFAPNFADVIIRDPETWKEAPIGKSGVIQVLSLLPVSYPGHSILSEDLGIVYGIDDAPCGRRGKYFSIIGRAPQAELRGCSDTHAYGDSQ